MVDALRYLKEYEIWFYVLFSVGGLVAVRLFLNSWEELRGAAFGLERESAQGRVNQSAAVLVLMLAMAIGVFTLVSFVAPNFPGANPLLTPTLNILATATTTLPAVTPMPTQTPQPTSTLSPAALVNGGGCTTGEVMLTNPKNGTEISGVVTLKGTAMLQNFGYFKYEVAHPGDTVWLTIQVIQQAVKDNELGQLDTRTLPNGDYLLRLVVTDNQGTSLPPCIIQIRINNPA